MGHAKRAGATIVADAAFRRLIAIGSSAEPGSVEHDFWSTLIAFEEMLSEERGKTTRLARTRQKLTRCGVVQTLEDWAFHTTSTDGFDMLIARGMPELTGEAVVLRHPSRFADAVKVAAARRLEEAGVRVGELPASLA
jgi:hypothetical protein